MKESGSIGSLEPILTVFKKVFEAVKTNSTVYANSGQVRTQTYLRNKEFFSFRREQEWIPQRM